MSPKTLALALATTAAVAGCTLDRNELRPETTGSILGRAGNTGRVIEPKRCGLKVVILARPLGDKAVHSAVWGAADEQVVSPEARRALAANGLRVGLITGGLPADVEKALNAPPPDKVDPTEFNLPDGSNTLIALSESAAEASILLNRDGHVSGKDYKDASGFFRVTANQDGPTGVALRVVPEVHHGPILRRFDAMPGNAAALNGMQFTVKDGQQEETLRDLAASLTLQPNQILAVGCDPDRRDTLGSFLFTRPEANSDRMIQKVVLVWASRTNMGDPGSGPTPPKDLVPVEPPDLLPATARARGRDD